MPQYSLLIKSPFSANLGYGHDGFALARTFYEAGLDVHLNPTDVVPPIPMGVAKLLVKEPPPKFDYLVHHVWPGALGLDEGEQHASPRRIAWTMWEFLELTDELAETMTKKLSGYTDLLVYDEVSAEAMRPYAEEAGVPMRIIQGGYLPDEWEFDASRRDWSGPFRFIMVGQLHAQPLDAKVLTPTGWVRMGDIAPGVLLVDPEGGFQKVEEVSPRSIAPVFKVRFSDGSFTRCTGDHLWLVDQKRQRKPYAAHGTSAKFRNEWEPWTTQQILDRGLVGNGANWRFRVPIPRIDFEPVDLPLDPYLLGVLLGDGYAPYGGSIELTCAEACLLDEVVKVLPDGVTVHHGGGYKYRLTGRHPVASQKGVQSSVVGCVLDGLGLRGKTCPHKFVPSMFLYADEESRKSLLAGLLDTDGWVTPSGAGFASSSRALVDAMVFLVRSLGGQAYVSEKLTSRKPSREVRLTLPFNPFRMERKRLLWLGGMGVQDLLSRKIVSIEPDGEAEVQCLLVSGKSHTYVTDDLIVTHNSRKNPFAAIAAFNELRKDHEDVELHLKTSLRVFHPSMEQAYPGLKIHYAIWSHQQMYDFYANAHCYVAPSWGEGKNLPALEAQTMGIPVIYSDFGGHRQWGSAEFGWPVAGTLGEHEGMRSLRVDARALYEAMREAVEDRAETRRKGLLAQQIIPAQCSWTQAVQRVLDTIKP